MTGIVKRWDAKRGFGFISELSGSQDEMESVPAGRDVFVHYSALPFGDGKQRNLRQGEEVMFDLEIGERGASAVNVVRR